MMHRRRTHISLLGPFAPHRQRGAAVVLAMMFLMIFGSLAAAMAIVAEGNLRTADTHMRLTRARAAAETGMQYLAHRLDRVTAPRADDPGSGIQTTDGHITPALAESLWTEARVKLRDSIAGETHNDQPPYFETVGDNHRILHIGPIALGPSAPRFQATLQQHPIPGENYSSDYYNRPPYDGSQPATGISRPISSANPLDARFVRVKVWSDIGEPTDQITRSLTMDFRIDKRIPYALLSRSRIMIGQNVMIDGPVGSRFTDTQAENGHPIQMQSDFRGFLPQQSIDDLTSLMTAGGSYGGLDVDHDNRINVNSAAETVDMNAPKEQDLNSDGYIDGYDFFVDHLDSDGNRRISLVELENAEDAGDTDAQQLFDLIDRWGAARRPGYNDGFIDNLDRYAKVRGEVQLTAKKADWEADDGATQGEPYQHYFEGSIRPGADGEPMTFESTNSDRYQFTSDDFDVSYYRDLTESDLSTQALPQDDPDDTGPGAPDLEKGAAREAVPYGSAHPYDFYQRDLYRNMTFENVRIPEGSNAVFENCTFIGVTFVETHQDNSDANYGIAGTEEESGQPRYPSRDIEINGETRDSSKPFSNNLRFHDCTFEGAVVAANPSNYTHVRNKLSFTGDTEFKIDASDELTETEKQRYKRSTLLAPHFSVEMGSFTEPAADGQRVNLSGTIVAGLIDMRGQVEVKGTILTTYTPGGEDGPTLGGETPNFNTTLGYFSSEQGDLEAEPPEGGRGLIRATYDPTIPLPDGIMSPIEITPVRATYFEGG